MELAHCRHSYVAIPGCFADHKSHQKLPWSAGGQLAVTGNEFEQKLTYLLVMKYTTLLQDEVWSTLQATAKHAGQALPNDLMAKHHMQHMLAPGMLSQGALADALTELRQPLASEHASLQEAQQHLTAAAQV